MYVCLCVQRPSPPVFGACKHGWKCGIKIYVRLCRKSRKMVRLECVVHIHMYVYVVRSVCELIVAACRLEDITAREKGDIRKRTELEHITCALLQSSATQAMELVTLLRLPTKIESSQATLA